MRVLPRKLLRDLWLSREILMAIIAVIVVGTGCFVGMLSTYNNLERARSNYYSLCRMADFWVNVKKIPLTELDRVLKIPGISELQARIVFPTIVNIPQSTSPISGQVISLPSKQSSILNNIVLQRGSYFSQVKREEVIISERFAQAWKIALGSSLELIVNGQRKKFLVIATAISSEYMYLTPPGKIASLPGEYGLFYIKHDYAEEIFDFSGACNNLIGLFSRGNKEAKGAALQKIDQLLHSYGVFDTIDRERQFSHLAITSEIRGLKTSAIFLPIIFLGVAALILNVLMTRMAEQQRTIIGTLKALGYFDREIIRHFIQYGLIIGVLGALFGSLLGYIISGLMCQLYDTLFEFPRLDNLIYPQIITLAFVISIFFSLMGTLRGVRKVVLLSPSEAMRQASPTTSKEVFLEKWKTIWQGFDFRLQMVLRGLFRHKTRTIVGIIAAALGASIVLVGLGLNHSFQNIIDFQFKRVTLSDYNITLKDRASRSVLDEVSTLAGVTKVEPVLYISGTFHWGHKQKKISITGILPQATMTVPQNGDRRVIIPNSGITIPSRLADSFGIQAGDQVIFIPVEGHKKSYRLSIAQVTQSMFGLNVYANYYYLNQLLKEEHSVSKIQLKAQQTPLQRRNFYRQIKKYAQIQSVSEIAQDKKNLREQFVAKFDGVLFVMILFAGVIFFGSILNASLILILERQREIATLRVLGYHPQEIGAIFLWENLIINISGAILGLPLGYLLLQGMAIDLQNDSFSIPLSTNLFSWIGTIFFAIIFVFLAHVFVQRNINRLPWGDALKMKE